MVAAGWQHSLAVLANGTVAGWGDNFHGQATPPDFGGERVAMVAAGGVHSLAVLANGTVVGWGHNADGQVAPPDFGGERAATAGGECAIM